MKDFKSLTIKLLLFSGIMYLIDGLWKLMELFEYGKFMPNTSDTVIGVILAYSLYRNLKVNVWWHDESEATE